MLARTRHLLRPLVLLMSTALASVVIAVVLLASPAHAAATTFTVNSPDDTTDTDGCTTGTGGCTLREAIDAANATTDADTINFNLGSSATIKLSSSLPLITSTVTIDGGSSNLTIDGGNAVKPFLVRDSGVLTLNNLTVANGNSGGSSGGGIINGGTLMVNNSTFSGNSAPGGSGAGIANQVGTVTVSNSTFSDNSAGHGGGGIANTFGGTVTVSNSTFSDNSAGSGGGGIANFASATLKNTIVANSPAGGDCVGASDGGYNLVEDGSCLTEATSLSGDPMLGPLADNGGPTKTHALLKGSPAIDKGKSFGETTDQRGKTRPSNFADVTDAPEGDGSDIGAYEEQVPDTTAPTISCSVNPSKLSLPANNHKLVTVTASVQVSDSGSGADGFKLLSVTSNQADSGLAKDDVPNDIQGWTIGSTDPPDTSGQLRAERYGKDRVYTLTYQGKDKAGNTANCEKTVTVPKKA